MATAAVVIPSTASDVEETILRKDFAAIELGDGSNNTDSHAGVSTALNDSENQPATTILVRGTIVRKRKYKDHVSLAVRRIRNISSETIANTNAAAATQEQPEPPDLFMVPRSDPSLLGCFLGTIVEVCYDVQQIQEQKRKMTPQLSNKSSDDSQTQKKEQPKHSHKSVQSLRVVTSSPDPNAIQECLKLVEEGKLPLEIFVYNNIRLVEDLKQVNFILSMGPKDPIRRAWVKRISSGLKGEPVEELVEDATSEKGTEDNTKTSLVTVRPRKRLTHVKQWQKEVLEKLEASELPLDPIFPQFQFQPTITSEGESNDSNTIEHENDDNTALYNLPDPHNPTLPSGRHPKTRREYLHDKKWPQLQWLVQRLRPIVEKLRIRNQQAGESSKNNTESTKYIELLDVGGGRGDLAVAVVEAFDDVRVTVVDLNESSLEGGRAYYQSRKQKLQGTQDEDRVRFVCGDFAEYAKNVASQSFDIVTAWHACGDLSDYALEFAVRRKHQGGSNSRAFVICPCCYTKRHVKAFEPKWIGDYSSRQWNQQCIPVNHGGGGHAAKTLAGATIASDIRTIQKLAEINERPEITHRAMGLINTMRLRSLIELSKVEQEEQKEQVATFDITLEEYDLSYSAKNLVLIGIQK